LQSKAPASEAVRQLARSLTGRPTVVAEKNYTALFSSLLKSKKRA